MRRKLLSIILGAVMVLTVLTPVTIFSETYEAGADDENKTFGISSKSDFEAFRDGYATYRSYKVSLNNDIDFEDASYTQSLFSSTSSTFTGKFFGNGHTLSNFTVTASAQCSGMCPELSGRIENLVVSGATISSSTYFVGAVVGRLVEGGVVDGVTVTGTSVSGGSQTGGIVGKIGANSSANVCTVRNCNVIGSSTVSTTGSDGRCGGILGQNQANVFIDGCVVDNCTISANSSGPRAGGIIGYVTGSSIGDITVSDCYVGATVQTNSGGRAGGIIGFTDAHLFTLKIEGCVVTGTTGKAGTYNNGGLLGQLHNTGNLTVVIEDCISVGSVLAGGSGGILIGNYSNAAPLEITRVYSTGTKYGAMSGSPVETDLQIVEIDNATELVNVAKSSKNVNLSGITLKLTDDIDMNGIDFPMFGNGTTTYFAGSFDGQDNTISNLSLTTSAEYSGLFMAVQTSDEIKDFTLENYSISGTSHVGAVAGFVRGTGVISGITVDGASSVTGSGNRVGGITGRASNDVQITDCTVSCDVTGGAGTGGIAGAADLAASGDGIRISGCAVNGDVSSASGQMIGGIIGQIKVNAAPKVSITDCVVNGDVTGNADKVGGIIGGPADNASWTSLTITGGSVNGTVTGGGADVGGVIGTVTSAMTISDIDVSGDVNGGETTYHVGGIIGAVRNGTATVGNSQFTGNVTNTSAGKFAGGIVAGIVNNSSALSATDVLVSGNVTATVSGYVGGIVGGTFAQGSATVGRALVTGTINAPVGQAGAFFGETNNGGSAYLTGTISDSYALNNVCTGTKSASMFGLLGSGNTDIVVSADMSLTKAQLAGVKARTNAAGLFANGGDDNWKSVLAAYPVLAAFSDAVEIIAQYEADISSYRGATYTAPTGPAGTIFAGWYTSDAMTTALGENVTTGAAYAKFVDEEVLKVRSELLTEGEHDKIRIVTTADSLKLSSIGFVLQYSDGTTSKTKDLNATTVYSRLTGWTDPSVFSIESSHFCSYKLNAASELKTIIDEGDGIDVTPYWITLDGTRVSGPTVTGLKFSD
ncbi:MAG: hypothetical protein IKR26_00250 [Lachnospiraceae bacterium]|nr:hypothetical protein [Lachnospiraceae bacterium]